MSDHRWGSASQYPEYKPRVQDRYQGGSHSGYHDRPHYNSYGGGGSGGGGGGSSGGGGGYNKHQRHGPPAPQHHQQHYQQPYHGGYGGGGNYAHMPYPYSHGPSHHQPLPLRQSRHYPSPPPRQVSSPSQHPRSPPQRHQAPPPRQPNQHQPSHQQRPSAPRQHAQTPSPPTGYSEYQPSPEEERRFMLLQQQQMYFPGGGSSTNGEMSEEEKRLRQAYASYLFDHDDYDDYDHSYPPLPPPPASSDFPYEPPPISTDDLFATCKWVDKKPGADPNASSPAYEKRTKSEIFAEIPQRLEEIYQLSNKNRTMKKKKQEKQGLPKIQVTDDDEKYNDYSPGKSKNPIEDYESTLSFVVTLGWLQPNLGDPIPPRPVRQAPLKKKKGYPPSGGFY